MTISISDLSPAKIRRLRILGVIFELAGQNSGTDVNVSAIEERLKSELDLGRVSLLDEFGLLKQDDYLNYFEDFDGIGEVLVTAAGRNVAEEFELARGSLTGRRQLLRDTYLNWLYQQTEESDGRSPTPDDFLATNPTFYGIPYTATDLEKAGKWLKDAGFIDGPAAWQYEGPLRPRLTGKGTYTVENRRSVADPQPSGGSTFNTTVHGSANIAQNSHDVQQTLIQNEGWVEQAASLADLLEQSLPSLGVEIRQSVADEVTGLRAELSGAAAPSRVRQAVTAIGGFLNNTTAGALGGVLTAQVLQLLTALPS